MNLLIDKLPTEYKGLKVETNFRSFILFELLMQDNELTERQKIGLALNLFFKERVDIKEGIEAILWFYSRGHKDENKKAGKKVQKNKNKIYSYEEDDDLIYSAFLDQYGIDLNEIEYLHWWKFKSLFNGLKSDNKIVEVMGYRSIDLNKIKDDETRKRYAELKRLYALKDNRTEQEKENDFAEALW